MAKQTVVQDPTKNAYQVGIAHRLRVDPRRINCTVKVNPNGGGLLVDVLVDGRDLNATERKLVLEYFKEELHEAPVRD